MDLLIRGIPAAVLLVTGAFGVVAGLLLPGASAANNGPGSGQVSPEMVKFGAALFIGGVAFLWVARGVWRSKLWRTRVALLFSVVALAHLIAAQYDLAHRGYPRWDDRAGPVALFIVLYVIALVCLVVAEDHESTAFSSERGPSAG